MAQNRIQFQFTRVVEKYGSKAQCAAALEKMRSPDKVGVVAISSRMAPLFDLRSRGLASGKTNFHSE